MFSCSPIKIVTFSEKNTEPTSFPAKVPADVLELFDLPLSFCLSHILWLFAVLPRKTFAYFEPTRVCFTHRKNITVF